MKRNLIKTIAIVLMFVVIAAVCYSVNAASDKTMSAKNALLTNQYDDASDNSGTAQIANNLLGAAITVIQVVGVGVAIIMLIVLAIKYISAAPSDKAEIKKHAVVYVVGAMVLFASTGILSIIKKFATNVNEQANEA